MIIQVIHKSTEQESIQISPLYFPFKDRPSHKFVAWGDSHREVGNILTLWTPQETVVNTILMDKMEKTT